MLNNIAIRLTLVLASAFACEANAADTAPIKTLTAFASDAELQAFFKPYGDAARARWAQELARSEAAGAQKAAAGQKNAPPMPSPPSPVQITGSSIKSRAAPAPASEGITNTQTAGVDEGGIVKVHGNHLVMLRRGRLFTVNIGANQLKSVSAIDAYGPGTDPNGTWYDEMLISGNTIAVIGFSYQRGGTEIGLFDIDQAGKLSYRSTYHMRSNDYYSSRNYASRQIGSKLIFYTPLHINPVRPDPLSAFPALRKWHSAATPADFKRIAPATRIYRTDDALDEHSMALHTVTVCDLAQREMRCEASGVLGPAGRIFYVSQESVYVWTTPSRRAAKAGSNASGLFRIPLDGSAPSALKVSGAPVDQFSFLESEDGHLNVVVSSGGRGEAMWGAEGVKGNLALLRVPLNSFSNGHDSAPLSSYRPLPGFAGYNFQNRFVGAWLLYGQPERPVALDKAPTPENFTAVRWAGTGKAQQLTLPHGVQRIEALGDDAVVIGAHGKDLHFTSVKLGWWKASLAGSYVRANASQAESRSHGFFYKDDGDGGGIIGLPIIHEREQGATASVLYLNNADRSLSELGALQSLAAKHIDDGCRASCVDWYGNARPLFLQGRVFALMGYELVEGTVEQERIKETRRISYMPQAGAQVAAQ
jgi:hypothetical protein